MLVQVTWGFNNGLQYASRLLWSTIFQISA